MAAGPLAMGADAVVTVRMVLAAGPLARGAYVVIVSAVGAVAGYFFSGRMENKAG